MAGGAIAAGRLDLLHDGHGGAHGESAAAVFLGDQRGKKSGLGQRLDECLRVSALAIEFAPVLAGKICAERADRFADRRKLGAFIHDLISARPLLTATTSRSTTRVRKLTTGPSRHISVRRVSPGKTGAEKRQANDASFCVSYPHMVLSTAWPAMPKLPSPCMIGRG